MSTFDRLFTEAYEREEPALEIRQALSNHFGKDSAIAAGRVAAGILAARAEFDEALLEVAKAHRMLRPQRRTLLVALLPNPGEPHG